MPKRKLRTSSSTECDTFLCMPQSTKARKADNARSKKYYEAHKKEAHARSRAWVVAHRDWMRLYKRRWRVKHKARLLKLEAEWRDENREKVNAAAKRWRLKNPGKSAAHRAVWGAMKAGHLTKPKRCAQCNKVVEVEAHHDDYSQPLVVRWLCTPCHHLHHGDLGTYRQLGRRGAKNK